MTSQSLSETANMLAEATDRLLLKVLTAEEAGTAWSPALWDALVDQDIPGALAATIDEDPADPDRLGRDGALNLLVIAGRHAAPVPLAEHMIAAWIGAQAGLDLPSGPVTIAGVGWHDALGVSADGLVKGRALGVAFAREAEAVLAIGNEYCALVPVSDLSLTCSENTADEARCEISFDGISGHVGKLPLSMPQLRAGLAGARAIQMAGALAKVLELTSAYVQERKQFGRPIGKFQAVQQALAELGGQVATAQAAANLASAAFGNPGGAATLAAAKIRTGEAVGIASRIAHQAHGAIGFTQEYELQRYTRRLWSWREDYGNESRWARWLGLALTEPAAGHDGDDLWELLTSDMPLTEEPVA